MIHAVGCEQPPGGSDEDVHELIAVRLGMPLEVFAQAKRVLLRGWKAAGDGRLYHPTMTERVLEMIERRRKEADRRGRNRAGQRACPASVPRDSIGTPAGETAPVPEPDSDEKTESPIGDSSPTAPADPPGGLKLVPKASDLNAERLSAVTKDALMTFNMSAFTKAQGGAVPNVSLSVGIEKRRQQVNRCLKTARDICRAHFGTTTITTEFWEAYWTEVGEDEFFSGRRPGSNGHENWTPDFEYLTRPGTMLKVYERSEAA